MFLVSMLLAASPMAAPTPTAIAPLSRGMSVSDAQGRRVGTILGADAYRVVLDTGSMRAAFSAASFRRDGDGAVFNLSKEQLDAMSARRAPRPRSRAVPVQP